MNRRGDDMEHQAIANVVGSIISLAGLWVLFHWPYRRYRQELLRERLFAARAELFDLAADGLIEFDHPAYVMLRNTANGFLNGAASFGTMDVISSLRRIDDEQASRWRERWESALAGARDPAREKIHEIRTRVNYAIVDHLVFCSFVLAITVLPAVLWLALNSFWRSLARRCRHAMSRLVDRLDSAAMMAA